MDISVLSGYITPVEEMESSYANKAISNSSFENWFDNQLNVFLNCTKTLKDYLGKEQRIMQTNDIRYKYEISITYEMINKYIEDKEKSIYYNRLIRRHLANLEFEAINGFDYDPTSSNKKNKKRTTKPKNKQLTIDTIEHKETAAERKLKQKAFKMSFIKFNPINSKNNGNSI